MQLDLIQELEEKIRKCKTCGGRRYRLDGRGKSVSCECLNEAMYELRLTKSGIPPQFKKLSFKDYMYQNSDTFKKIWKYIEQADKALEMGTGLLLFGPNNTGKSMLACCIIKELIKRGHDGGFVTFSGVMSDPQESDKFLSKEFSFSCIDNITEVLDRLVNFTEATLTHELSNGAVNRLIDVLSARVLRNQPTILTSVVSISKISSDARFQSLGTLLLSNFMEVECVSGDFRGDRAQERLLKTFGFDQLE